MSLDGNFTASQNVCSDPEWGPTLPVQSSVAGCAIIICIFAILLAAILFCREGCDQMMTVRLVLYIVLSSITRSIFFIIPALYHPINTFESFCIASGYLYRNVSMIIILFTLTATIHTLLVTIADIYAESKYYQCYTSSLCKLEVVYVLLSIALPFTYTWIPFVYSKVKLDVWCGSTITNYTCGQLLWGVVYFDDIPRLTFEVMNFFILSIFCCVCCRRHYEYNAWIKQVLPIFIHSFLYMVMNWVSLLDNLNRIFGFASLKLRDLHIAHCITSAGRELVVGIVFTTYLSIMLCISLKYRSKPAELGSEGHHSLFLSSSLEEKEASVNISIVMPRAGYEQLPC